jgi:hypothetical protein
MNNLAQDCPEHVQSKSHMHPPIRSCRSCTTMQHCHCPICRMCLALSCWHTFAHHATNMQATPVTKHNPMQFWIYTTGVQLAQTKRHACKPCCSSTAPCLYHNLASQQPTKHVKHLSRHASTLVCTMLSHTLQTIASSRSWRCCCTHAASLPAFLQCSSSPINL